MKEGEKSENLSILRLFCSELKVQIASMESYLSRLNVAGDLSETINALTKITHSIIGAAKIIRYEAIASLTKALNRFFLSLPKENNEPLPTKSISLLGQIIDYLKSVAELDEMGLTIKMEHPDEQLERFETELALYTQAPSDVLIQAETPSRSVAEEEMSTDPGMVNLFRIELENQTRILNNGLVSLEHGEKVKEQLDALMRAAHSIKGAARVVRLEPFIKLAHSLEEYFVAAQKNELVVNEKDMDVLLGIVDFFSKLSSISNATLSSWLAQEGKSIEGFTQKISAILKGDAASAETLGTAKFSVDPPPILSQVIIEKTSPIQQISDDRVVRITAHSLNRLMGLAGESLVESRWLHPFAESLLKQKKSLEEVLNNIDLLKESFKGKSLNESEYYYFSAIQQNGNECKKNLNDRLLELELFITRHSRLSDRLYQEVIDSRMRPFADGIEAFPRMVRDLARQLNKKVRLEIIGKSTSVDRDILEKLESPLAHLLRNAIDHGIEPPEQRLAAGKPIEGTIRLEAQHRAGMLAIIVSDDGRGVDTEEIRKIILDKKIIKPDMAKKLNDNELIEFLFLPSFSTTINVTEISGRGVGLNIVQNMLQEVSGNVQVFNYPGKGMSFNLQLPLTLSVIRALLVEVGGESYAFPLARINRAVFLAQKDLEIIENRQYFCFEGENIGLVSAWQILEKEPQKVSSNLIPVIILSDRANSYGIVVDKFLGEKELVVQELDTRLGKVADVSAGAFMEDGSPVLIVDVEDVIRSIDNILTGGRLKRFSSLQDETVANRSKKILVVDDSITVREVECRLLRNHGYVVETAVNGVDGWNSVRMGNYDLVITDVDMPRMNGIELVKAIRADTRLKSIPVMIVSYKEREEERVQGLEAGANYYLTKSSFHDQTLLNVVIDLIGKA